MATGRDDFSEGTKQIAAKRVGYRCSFPRCMNATVGASMESSSGVSSTGVACHICAAARGGPRYDDHMTPEERKSVENCIWMCQTHSKLIDTDETQYTVELLKQWKKEAEESASKALANGDFFSEYYKSNGDNLSVIQQLFDDMIVDGRFDELNTMLSQYKTTLSDWHKEFIMRYRIIYDVYCSRNTLNDDLNEYCDLPCKNGVDDLAKLFIAFQLNDELGRIIELCVSEQIHWFSEMLISDELEEKIFGPVGSNLNYPFPEELKKTISQYIVNYVCMHKIIGAMGSDGNAYPLYVGEFYYHAVAAAHNIISMTALGNSNFDSIITSPDYLFITDNIERIKLLDNLLQEYIWAGVLTFLSSDYRKFNEIFPHCPDEIKTKTQIKRAEFLCQIMNDVSSVDTSSLTEFCDKSGEYGPLLTYIASLDMEKANEFLDEHGYLYRKDSSFLQLKYDLTFEHNPQAGHDFLCRYEENYKEDFTFQCLMVRCMPDGALKQERIEWIIEHNQTGISARNSVLYMHVLKENKRWSELAETANKRLPNESLFYLAGYLAESNIDELLEKSQSIYQSLLNKKWERRNIRFNLGLLQYHFGHVEAAKKSFQEEYDIYQNNDALKQLMSIRYETHDYRDDFYLEQLKHCVDAQSQNCVGAIYMKRRNLVEARKYFLRSLLLNDVDNYSINGYWQVTSSIPPIVVENVKDNTVCTLKNTSQTLKVAIHSPEILQGIPSPNRFALCKHYSSEDIRIAALLYHTKDDSVVFEDEEFVIESIETIDDTFNRFFFASMVDREGVITLRASSGEEFLANITPILKSTSEGLEKAIDEYNQQDILFPLSFLASSIGKRMLNTLEFLLYENKPNIRNNLSFLDDEHSHPVFVMSYDAIVILVYLGIELNELPKDRMICARQVKNQLLADIDEELSSITDEKRKGSMIYTEGKPVLFEQTTDWRRDRYSFLLRIKDFVVSIEVAKDSLDYESDNVELKDAFNQLFSTRKMFCESGALALAKTTDNSVLVTDDQFLYGISNTDNIPSVGIIGLLMDMRLGWEKLLSISKALHRLNYANYLPMPLYKQMVDSLLEDNEEVERGSTEIQQWLRSDTQKEPSEHHEDVITALARDVHFSNLQYLDPDNLFAQIVFPIWAKRNPELLEKCITEVLDGMEIKFQDAEDQDQA